MARHAYCAAVTYVDEQSGRVLYRLSSLGLEQSTLTLLYSDHGYHLGEYGSCRKGTLFGLAARVPLIIRAPWKPRSVGQRTSTLAELVDLYPTVAALAGAPAP